MRVTTRGETMEEVFTRYARKSYDKIVGNIDHYKKMIGDAADTFKGCGTVADIGCGTGNLTVELAMRGTNVIAVDNNKEMLAKAKEKVKRAGLERKVEFQEREAHRAKLQAGSVDGVAMLNVLYALDDPFKSLDKANKALKTGGRIVLTGPKPDQNVGVLIEAARRDLTEVKGITQEDIRTMERINRMLMEDARFYTTERLSEICSKYAGFQTVLKTDLDAGMETFKGQGYFIAARKDTDYGALPQEDIVLRRAAGDEIEEAFKLRYHVMADRLDTMDGTPELHELQQEFDSFDDVSNHYIAAYGNIILAYQRCTRDDKGILPMDQIASMGPYRGNGNDLRELGRWVALPVAAGAGQLLLPHVFSQEVARGASHFTTLLDGKYARQYQRMGFKMDWHVDKRFPGTKCDNGFIEVFPATEPPTFYKERVQKE